MAAQLGIGESNGMMGPGIFRGTINGETPEIRGELEGESEPHVIFFGVDGKWWIFLEQHL